MTERVWDRYLTEQDRAHLATKKDRRWGFGEKPAVLLIDLYRWVFGDEPEPLLEATKKWPGSCGLAGWNALPYIQELIGTAREVGIPVVHVTGMDGFPRFRKNSAGEPELSPEEQDRLRRRYQIVDEVAPIEGEWVIYKASPSAFWSTPLVSLLQAAGIDTLIVAGESTSGCVRASVVDARTNRFRITVVEEGVFDRHEATHALNLFDMHEKYADVLSLAEVLPKMRAAAGVLVPA